MTVTTSSTPTPSPDPRRPAAPAGLAGARWVDVQTREAALPELPATLLLHAGPPLHGDPPAGIRAAAIAIAVAEGLASDAAGAAADLDAGRLRLAPAQDHGIVTPLAQVVGPRSVLFVVAGEDRRCLAPLIEGPPPALRFGRPAPDVRAQLAELAALGTGLLGPLARHQPIDLFPIVAEAVAGGDECHARTAVANQALTARLLPALADERLKQRLANPGFVLPLLMAACGWSLADPDSTIVAAGGNGLHFGLRLRGETGWRQVAAEPPVGPRFGPHADTVALGAIGDSAVIDFAGLGGQSLAAAPALLDEWRAWLPADAVGRGPAITDPTTGRVDGGRVRVTGRGPLVDLAILDRDADAGLIGRGFFDVPVALFGAAPT